MGGGGWQRAVIFSRFAEVFSVHLRVDNVETSVRASKKKRFLSKTTSESGGAVDNHNPLWFWVGYSQVSGHFFKEESSLG